MTEHEVARTLVKSAPELWEVCSDPDSLARHLQAFGEIRITRVEPETTVAWEGERASGTVRIEPSGWGTRVTLTATPASAPAPAVGGTPVSSEPDAVAPASPPDEPAGRPAGEIQIDDAPTADSPISEGREAAQDASLSPPDAPPADRPRPGFFRRLGGLLFRSLVTPMEVPDEAFAAPDGAPTPDHPNPGAAAAPKDGSEREPESGPGPDATSEPVAVGPAMAVPPVPARPEPDLDPGTVLTRVLDKLGSDHHRPFSRS